MKSKMLWAVACAAVVAAAVGAWPGRGTLLAQGSSMPGKEPDLSGIWDGTPRAAGQQ